MSGSPVGNTNDDPSGRVCPRCGIEPSSDETFCAGCGLNLRQQSDLPTRAAFQAQEREQRWLSEQTAAGATKESVQTGAESVAGPRRFRRSMLAGASVLSAAIIGIAIWQLTNQSGGGEEDLTPQNCEDITITPNSDDGIFGITASGISCDDAEQVLREWGEAGYPGDGPEGFSCEEIEGAENAMLGPPNRCVSGSQVIEFL